MARALAALAVAGVLLAGCGESSGVEDGATVTAYVGAPLCGGAKRALEEHGPRAGDVRVRVFCLEATAAGGGTDLAVVGENARRVSEDSTAVGYLEAPGQAARFARPIVEAAGIATVVEDSGAAAMARLLDAIADADTGTLRASVSDALE